MTQIQIRRDTETNWTSVNPTLALGEWGYDTTNKVCKIGDGTTPWNTLPVYGGKSELPIATDTTVGVVKPDGTSITITDDGVISSTGGGSTSDTYTKAEIDSKLNAKQNVLTAHSPLSIDVYSYSNLEGWTYTSDRTGIYNTDTLYFLKAMSVSSSTNSILVPYGASSIQCRLVIPYQLGQVIKVPAIPYVSGGSTYYNVEIALCKMLSDGTLIPIIKPNSATTRNNINQIDNPATESASSVTFQAGGSGTTNAIPQVKWQGTDPNIYYAQLWEQDSDTVYVLGTNGLHAGCNYSYTGADAARLREVNCAVIVPEYFDGGTYEMHYGDSADYPLTVADFGLYNANQPLLSYEGPSSFTENLFSIEASSSITNLEFNISSESSNALEVKDDGLYASPYTLPTATSSVLGGVKIGNGVTISDDGTLSVASVNGFKFWSGTQTAYDGIATKDPNTLYIITG